MSFESRARVCVPVCVPTAGELNEAVARASVLADVIELRLDCLDDNQLEDAFARLAKVITRTPLPFIITDRPAGQGGRRALEEPVRVEFWRRVSELLREPDPRASVYEDVELDLLQSTHAKLLREILEGFTLICSQHDFRRTPRMLGALYERMARTGARVIKLAAKAEEITDCARVLALVERARRDGLEMIAVSMGEAGLLTRVLAPRFGASLTYGSLEAGSETAPGQLTARELRDIYRVQKIDADTIVTGIVGKPVAHSLSPHMHNAAFDARGVNAVYIPFEVADVSAFVRRMVRARALDWKLRGFSVTAPHKSSIIEHLDRVEPLASEIGAVNTVVVEGEELRGYNTDARAAGSALESLVELRDARVAVVGAGGAARALLWGLRERGARATVFARNLERARETAGAFDAQVSQLEGASFAGFDLVVNATPLGTRGARVDETPATAGQLRGAHIAYDLVYNPARTRFIKEAGDAGCETLGGLPMLVAQAAAQFELWTGEQAPFEVMFAAAERGLATKGK